MPFRMRFVLPLAVALLVPCPARAGAPRAAPVNSVCPVMPDRLAGPLFETQHHGRTVRFCCGECVAKFETSPAEYMGNLPPGYFDPPPVPSESETLLRLVENHPAVGITFAIAMGMKLFVSVVRRRTANRAMLRFTSGLSGWAWIAVAVLAAACIELVFENARMEGEAVVAAHVNAPEPLPPWRSPDYFLNWAWPQALHELPRGLRGTYYRGNDERSPMLFNNGVYRTATFHLAVRDDQGRDLAAGESTAGRRLQLHFRVERAPNTTPLHYEKSLMNDTWLACDLGKPRPTVTRATAVREDWEWLAVSDLPPLPPQGVQRLNRTWFYFCRNPLLRTDAQLHYYIQCAIHTVDGVVQPESSVWMIPVFASPILKGANADREWFGDRPIPVIPDGKQAEDPKLLGVPDKK